MNPTILVVWVLTPSLAFALPSAEATDDGRGPLVPAHARIVPGCAPDSVCVESTVGGIPVAWRLDAAVLNAATEAYLGLRIFTLDENGLALEGISPDLDLSTGDAILDGQPTIHLVGGRIVLACPGPATATTPGLEAYGAITADVPPAYFLEAPVVTSLRCAIFAPLAAGANVPLGEIAV